MIWNAELREEHFVKLARFLWHGGPYIVLMGAMLMVGLQFGWIDKPAWSADINQLERKIEALRKDVDDVDSNIGTLKGKIDRNTGNQRQIQTNIDGLNEKLGTIDEKTSRTLQQIENQLNILINRGLTNNGSTAR